MKIGFHRWPALLVVAVFALAGCNKESATPGSIETSDATSGAGGTAVGQTSTSGVTQTQTGTSTQRTGTGYAGPISTPGPGPSGR